MIGRKNKQMSELERKMADRYNVINGGIEITYVGYTRSYVFRYFFFLISLDV